MSGKEDPDYVVVDDENDHDVNTDDETKEDSETENSVNTDNSGGALRTQSNFENDNENCQQLLKLAHGFEGAEVKHDPLVSQVSQPANLKRYMSESTEQFCSSNKRGRTSPPRQDNISSPRQDNISPSRQQNTGRRIFEHFYYEYHRDQLRIFQWCFQSLKELIEETNRQIAHLNGIFSAIQEFWELAPAQQHDNGEPSSPVARRAAHTQENPPEISLQSASSCQAQESSVAVPVVVPPLGDSCVAINPDRVNYSDILGNEGMIPDTTSLSTCILPHFGMPGTAEPSSGNNSETRNYPPVTGNDNSQCPLSSTASTSSDSNANKIVLIEPPEKAEANLKDSKGTMYYAGLPGSFTDRARDSSSATNSSNFADENFILVEVPANTENKAKSSPEIMSYPSSLENYRDQSLSSSFLSVCPNCGMLNKEESNLEQSPQPMNNLRLVEYSNDNLSSCSSWNSPPSIESDSAVKPESTTGENLMENITDPDGSTGPSSTSSNFEILVETETNMESNPGTMNHPNVLRYCACQRPPSSSVSHPSFGYFGNPYRYIQIPNSVMDTAKSQCHPQQAAKYLLHHLFTEDVLIRSNVYGSSDEGLCALDSNRISALREFLQDNYPVHDLTESGCDWKLCVIAIDDYLCSFRSDLKKTTIELLKQLSTKNP
ncbi:PREDICTED: BEN domain-containing protein 2 isoform X2 [Chinchilla lanigera]|uniref:BEN domain-containing protein 2 isoform X2 n=1 Tax=Chinchilla lanigera TaxID=34839 RepID=UPI0006975CCF|nr:PREDICTED: BEN domain-containing protein 2 isoform X2 [Chinchilla lanigera]